MSRGAGHPKSGHVLSDTCAYCERPWRECRGVCLTVSPEPTQCAVPCGEQDCAEYGCDWALMRRELGIARADDALPSALKPDAADSVGGGEGPVDA